MKNFFTAGSSGFCFLISDIFSTPKSTHSLAMRSSHSVCKSLVGLPGTQRGHLRAKNAQHGVIDLFLPAREPAAHGNRARQIAHVIAQAGGHIEQQQIAVLQGWSFWL